MLSIRWLPFWRSLKVLNQGSVYALCDILWWHVSFKFADTRTTEERKHHHINRKMDVIIPALINWGTCCCSVSTVSTTAAVLPTLFNFPRKPLKLISSNHICLTYGVGKMFWHPSRWPWVKVTKLPKRDQFYLVPTTKWESLVDIPPCHVFNLVKFWRNFVKKILAIFFVKFPRRFPQSNILLAIS